MSETPLDSPTAVPFEHFVITPYFVRFTENKNDRDAKLRAEPDWLVNRLRLFRTYCLPSVTAQTNQNFRWHLYFDDNIPSDYLAEVQSLTAPHTNIELKMCSLFDRKTLENNVKVSLKPETRWVLTTRLDNDDGWHCDFVKKLHAQVTVGQRQFLNYPLGLIYYDGHVYLYKHPSNAFISFLETSDDFLTVWCGPHAYLERIAPVRQLNPFPAFVQVIHGQTRSNKPRGVRIHRVLALEGFDAIPELMAGASRDTDLDIMWNNVTSASTWAARDRAVAFVRGTARRLVRTGIGGSKVADLLRPLTVDY